MERLDCAYLINTTPKYFYLLPLHIALLQRYAPTMAWPIYLAIEEESLADLPELPSQVIILTLPNSASGFLESRAVATKMLPESIKYVFPIQEDFLLQGRPMEKEIAHALITLEVDSNVLSVRLMPCPGPKGDEYNKSLKILDFDIDGLVFTYQATLWKRAPYELFMNTLLHSLEGKTQAQKNHAGIKVNIAEISQGQRMLYELFPQGLHLAFPRPYPHPNAVYLCPWPYRPTAVVRGHLEQWAIEFAQREGFPLEDI